MNLKTSFRYTKLFLKNPIIYQSLFISCCSFDKNHIFICIQFIHLVFFFFLLWTSSDIYIHSMMFKRPTFQSKMDPFKVQTPYLPKQTNQSHFKINRTLPKLGGTNTMVQFFGEHTGSILFCCGVKLQC